MRARPRSRSPIAPRTLLAAAATSPFRARPGASWRSPTAAAPAASAHATAPSPARWTTPVSRRCCSICSPRTRRSTVATSSTSRCSPTGSLAASAWLRERSDVGQPAARLLRREHRSRGRTDARPLSWATQVGAVVSRGGRPDLARGLSAVRAPTLLIVGGRRPSGARAQPRGPAAASLPERARGRPRRDAPLRGARRTRAGQSPGDRLARPPPTNAINSTSYRGPTRRWRRSPRRHAARSLAITALHRRYALPDDRRPAPVRRVGRRRLYLRPSFETLLLGDRA